MLTLFVMKLLSIFANGTADVSSEQEAGDTSLRSDFGDMKFCSIQSLTKYFQTACYLTVILQGFTKYEVINNQGAGSA